MTELFLVHIFLCLDWTRRFTEKISLFSPNIGKYGPEITRYLGTFQALYLHHRYNGLNCAFRRVSPSSSAINKHYKEVQVLFRWHSVFFILMFFFLPNFKMLLLGTTSARSKSVSLEIYSYVQSGLASCEISGYRPTTFSVHKTILSGKFGKERSLFKKSFVFLI